MTPVRPLLRAWLLPALVLIASTAFAGDLAVSGVVRDGSGGVIVRASISLLTAEQAIVQTTRTDESGQFAFSAVPSGRYLLVVAAPGFAESRTAVAPGEAGLAVTLDIQPVRSEVTVTASRGTVQEMGSSSQAVTVIDASDITMRSKEVVAQAVSEETGVHLLRTSPTMSGIYVRGLTGAKVNIFIDGVRYSTSAQRGGVNTFLDLIEPTSLQAIEVLHGPNSAQYGSDALGGSIQFLSQLPSFVGDGSRSHGVLGVSGGTASSNAGTNLAAGYGSGQFGLFVNLAVRRVGDIRTGGGIDSHAAPTRFLGVSSDLLLAKSRSGREMTCA